MCGIVGILNWKAPPDTLLAAEMTDRLMHRGPDARNIVAQRPIVLGHRRLAIIDLSESANQPMVDQSGHFWLVYNGEVYNFREVRRELEAGGVEFRTASDTEVILEAYKRWDVGCLERFNGMFAFGLWDDRRQRLMLARDRAGEKPLFYQSFEDGVVFASELSALRKHPAVSGRVNPRALGQYLAFNHTLGPECMLEGVRKLEPAHYLLVQREGPSAPVEYWSPAAHFRTKRRFSDSREAAESLRSELDRAVRLRLVSDVALGAFLSGGLDSSSVVAAMCGLRRADVNETFSIGFQQDTYSELPWARAAAKAVGLARHHEQVVSADLPAALPDIVRASGEPVADSSMIPMYYLAKFARERVTVCLSGDGADEMLAGYETYVADRLRHASWFVPRIVSRTAGSLIGRVWPASFDKVSAHEKFRRFLAGHSLPFRRAHASWRTIFDEGERRSLVRPEHHDAVLGADPLDAYDRHFDAVRDCHYLDQAMYVDLKTWLADDVLVKVDRMTMAHSLESRAPFLDHHFIEFAASLPIELKLSGLTTKTLLKRSQVGRLPQALIERKKEGFNAPVSHWLNAELKELARDATSARVLGEWFIPGAVERLWDEHAACRRDHGLKLFGLTCLGLWLQDAA